MKPLLFAALPTWEHVLRCPTFWALASGALGLWLLLPRRYRLAKIVGGLLMAMAGGLFAYDLPRLGDWTAQGVFWLLALVAIGGGVAMITSQSPVYSAIWFALSLLGTAGLFIFQGAQFLGVATIVVYAGAIVVTFLFVIMLAQPAGHAVYDRVSWGWFPKPAVALMGAALLAWLLSSLTKLDNEATSGVAADRIAARAKASEHAKELAKNEETITAL